ncbi:MAG: hypothetical protein JXN10_03175 [Clostridia bacterium]|nr:hypothetical protein [Clostridia bacterium]MBN2882503.1 hypothetical protein [Clostridia bacterium]
MYTTYNFAVGAEDLESAFNSGKSIWGLYISMSKTSSNPKGAITDFDGSGDGAIARTYSGTYWTITLNRYWYGTLAYKSIIWAHEIGHVYGITHVTTATNYLMYPIYSSSMYLHNYEKLGMENCTAAHISHNTSSYTDYDNTNHKVRCSVCRGYHYLEAHSYIEDPDICDYCGMFIKKDGNAG